MKRQLTRLRSLRYASLLVAGVISIVACDGSKPARVTIGPQVQADMVILFKAGTSGEEINRFLEHAIFIGPADGEHRHRPGIQSILRVSVHGCQGYAVNFGNGATLEQRDAVRADIVASPVVFKFFEGLAPADIGPNESCGAPT